MQPAADALVESYADALRSGRHPMRAACVGPGPTGRESGTAVGIDIGGTNLRVAVVSLEPGGACRVLQYRSAPIPQHLKRGAAAALFSHVARAVMAVLQEGRVAGELPLGATISYPLEHQTLLRCRLLSWAKDIDCPDAVGRDVSLLLEEAFRESQVPVRLRAVLNDTTAVLVANRWRSRGVQMAAVFGTGTNGCAFVGGDVVNAEWGALSAAEIERSGPDLEVDAASLQPGAQQFEKLVAGLYLGAIVRASLDGDQVRSIEASAGQPIDTPLVSDVLDGRLAFSGSEALLSVGRRVFGRAARLGASAVVALWRCSDAAGCPAECVVEGALFERCRCFAQSLQDECDRLSGGRVRLVRSLAQHSSCVGACVAALFAQQ